jgi:hypothetical protein
LLTTKSTPITATTKRTKKNGPRDRTRGTNLLKYWVIGTINLERREQCYGSALSLMQDTKIYHWSSGASGLKGYVIQHYVYGASGVSWLLRNSRYSKCASTLYEQSYSIKDRRDGGPPWSSSLPHTIDLVLLLEYIAYKLWLHHAPLTAHTFPSWNNPQLTKAYTEVPLPQQVLVRIPC